MNEMELIQALHNLNETELFYMQYQEARKDPKRFRRFLNQLDVESCVEKHLVIPEFPETMPDAMRDEYFYSDSEIGMVISKHNCYSPVFQHFHTYFEAFYVFEGICVQEIGGKRQTLRMGDLCIIPPGISHSISVQDSSIVINLINSSSVIENVFKNPLYYRNNVLSDFFVRNMHFSVSNSYLIFHTGNDHELKDLILQMMLEYTNRYQEYEAILNAYFTIFFGKLLRYYENTAQISDPDTHRSRLSYELNQYIQENHQKISLSDIARRFGYSDEYTSRLIKQLMGRSFSEILADARMKHAAALLKSTNLPVRDIAYQVGYENPENFIRTFKKHNKKTPTEYRRNLDAERRTG
ncbi:MAG: helix-turn-helix domain-containing protein [Lachnospiraceae bacterium]|nr:helix-turn-helix domain-containing protein [Lachnospiraceae bacterium]